QRIDLHIALALINALRAGKRVPAINIHGAGTANAFAAGTAESQRLIDFVLDLDEGVENHRPAFVEIDFIGVDARIGIVIRRPAIDAETLDVFRTGLGLESLALIDR